MSASETEEGFAIVDGRGRAWDKHLYPTREAAEKTAAACLAGGRYSIVSATKVHRVRQVTSTTLQPVTDFVLGS